MKVQEDQNHPVRDRILRQAAVEAKVGFKKTKLFYQIAEGNFPKPIAIGPRSVGWRESEIDAWIAKLPRAGRQNAILDKARAARRCNRNNQATPAA
ncbi:MAG: helix-turn-helix transcriptional regulator [Rhodomicrobium sp.]